MKLINELLKRGFQIKQDEFGTHNFEFENFDLVIVENDIYFCNGDGHFFGNKIETFDQFKIIAKNLFNEDI